MSPSGGSAEGRAAKQPPTCGKIREQCGGTVAVRLKASPESGYGGDAEDAQITIDVLFAGAACCRRGLMCAIQRETPSTSFSQCVDDLGWVLNPLQTQVPAQVLREYRESNNVDDLVRTVP